jgi:predicted nucleotidyltransferase
MPASLNEALTILRANEAGLRKLGAEHAAVFGSVARGEAGPESDVDVLVDLSPDLDLFAYSRLRIHIGELLNGADVVNRTGLKPLLRDNILRDAINAF